MARRAVHLARQAEAAQHLKRLLGAAERAATVDGAEDLALAEPQERRG